MKYSYEERKVNRKLLSGTKVGKYVSRKPFFKLTIIAKLFRASLLFILLIAGTGVFVLSHQNVSAQFWVDSDGDTIDDSVDPCIDPNDPMNSCEYASKDESSGGRAGN